MGYGLLSQPVTMQGLSLHNLYSIP